MKRIEERIAILGAILKAMALNFYNCMPYYKNQMEPKWSNGWLDRFKRRYNIKEYKQHGEGASAEVNTLSAIQQIDNLCLECSNYRPCDIFNMDEIGLF